jgi:hypothetical protein
MSIKIYLHFEESGFPEKTSKIVVPKSWTTTKTIEDIIDLFAKSHNPKNPDHQIIAAESHLENSEGLKIYSNAVCGTVLDEHGDYHIKRGSYNQIAQASKVDENAGKILGFRMKNGLISVCS